MAVTSLGHGDEQPTIAADGRPQPSPALRDRGRRGARRLRHRRLLLQRLLRLAGRGRRVFGVFAVNGWANVLHILSGALGLLVAGYAARRYALWLGAFYLVLALWGFAIGSGEAILGFLPVDTGDNVLHLVLGALGVRAALATPAPKKREGPAATA